MNKRNRQNAASFSAAQAERKVAPQTAGAERQPARAEKNPLKTESQPQKAEISLKTAGTAFTVAVLFSLVVTLVLSVALSVVAAGGEDRLQAFLQSNGYAYLAFLLPQAAFFLAIFTVKKMAKLPFLSLFSYQKSGATSYLFALLALFGLLYGFGWMNELFIRFLALFGYAPPASVLPQMPNFAAYLLAVLVVAVLPALAEECLFRGIMARGTEKLSAIKAALLCGICFSLFHQSPAQTPYQLLCGVVFALIALKTGNIFLTVGMHFLNNFWIITTAYFSIPSPHGGWEIALTVLGVFALSVALVYFVRYPKKGLKTDIPVTQTPLSAKPFLLYALPGLAVCGFLWIYALISGIG